MTQLCDINYDFIKIDDAWRKAVLFAIDGEDVWLPRSQIEISEEDKQVTLPEWLAVEKGLV